jgi:hypothetical protein
MSTTLKNVFVSVLSFTAYELSNILAGHIWNSRSNNINENENENENENDDENNVNNNVNNFINMETIRVGILIPMEYLLSKYFGRPIRIAHTTTYI